MTDTKKSILILSFIALVVIGISIERSNRIKPQPEQSIANIKPKQPTYSKCTVEVNYKDGRSEVYVLDVYEDKFNIFLNNEILWYMKYLHKKDSLIAQSTVIGKEVKNYGVIEEKPCIVQF